MVWESSLNGSEVKASACNAGDLGLIPGSRRFPGEGNGNPLQYSCLENHMDGGAWSRLLSMGSQRVRHDWETSLILTLNLSTKVNYISSVCWVTESCLTLVMPWTVACQAPLSIGFSRQEYWSGLPFPSPGNLLDPGIEPRSPALEADSFTVWVTREPHGLPKMPEASIARKTKERKQKNWLFLLSC